MFLPRRVIAAALLPAIAAAGCAVDRRLRIATQPAGADVFVDGRSLGSAPVEYVFTHYGVRRIRVEHAGFQPLEQVFEIDAPWYGAFPFDLFSEVLIPLWREDHRELSVALQPKGVGGEDSEELAMKREAAAVLRAKALRRWIPNEEPPP